MMFLVVIISIEQTTKIYIEIMVIDTTIRQAGNHRATHHKPFHYPHIRIAVWSSTSTQHEAYFLSLYTLRTNISRISQRLFHNSLFTVFFFSAVLSPVPADPSMLLYIATLLSLHSFG